MKTIQVSDEAYEFLKSCQDELNNQDVRGTASPIFGFMTKNKIASYDPQDFIFINEGHTDEIVCTEEENWEDTLAKYILERYDYDVVQLEDRLSEVNWIEKIEDDDDDTAYLNALENQLSTHIRSLHYYEYESFVESFSILMYGYAWNYEMYQSSVSIFESDMQAHMDLNKHNMRNSHRTYVFSNFRTPKLGKLCDILKKDVQF